MCVSTYSDSVNSRLELEDTRYVIDELKKSQESLRNRCGYEVGLPRPCGDTVIQREFSSRTPRRSGSAAARRADENR